LATGRFEPLATRTRVIKKEKEVKEKEKKKELRTLVVKADRQMDGTDGRMEKYLVHRLVRCSIETDKQRIVRYTKL